MEPTLAELIREAIRRANVRIVKLEELSTVSKTVIFRFLKGERTITVETAQKILAALGCRVEITRPGRKLVPVQQKK